MKYGDYALGKFALLVGFTAVFTMPLLFAVNAFGHGAVSLPWLFALVAWIVAIVVTAVLILRWARKEST
jgi:uncharacterized membrane protein (DUF485 family)